VFHGLGRNVSVQKSNSGGLFQISREQGIKSMDKIMYFLQSLINELHFTYLVYFINAIIL
jgi:hypothetical protein